MGVGHHDGHGVVGRGDVHSADKQAHAELAALPAAEQTLDAVQKSHEATVLADQRADGAHEHGHHGRLEHAGGAGAHVAEQIGGGDGALGHYDDGAGQDAEQKHDEHVDAHDAAHKHDEVRDELQQVVVSFAPCRRYRFPATASE